MREREYIDVTLFKMPVDGKWEAQSEVYYGTSKGVSPCKDRTVLLLDRTFCYLSVRLP